MSKTEPPNDKGISSLETSPSSLQLPSKTPLDSGSDIRYVYLTFDSAVPAPNLEQSSSSQAPPAAPKLSGYINPTLYPTHRKNIMLALSCVATFLTAYAAGSYSPAVSLLKVGLHAPTNEAVEGGVSTFCLGFGLAPMVLAPFSEINGRYPVFVVSGIIFFIFQAVCGVVTNLVGMLFARFFVGVGGSVFSTMVGGVIADLYVKEERNTPMALYSGFVLAGTGAGPLIGSAISQRLGDKGGSGARAAWRWVFWHQAIAAVVLMVALTLFFKETRASVLLSRKAKALNKYYEQLEQAGYYGVWIEEEQPALPRPLASDQTLCDGTTQIGPSSDEEKRTMASRRASSVSPLRLQRIRWVVKEDEERSSLTRMISVSLYRPFHLLFTEPVVFFFSIWVAFAWGVLYLTFSSVPLVFSRQHDWNVEKAGRIFATIVIGGILGTAVGILQERVLHHPRWQPTAENEADGSSRFWSLLRRRFPVTAPEARLYCTCLTAILLPAGLFIFGFTSKRDIHWIAPAIGICLATMGIYSVYLATFNYLADTYHKYASSALAAQSFCRNMLGGVFPLVTGFLFTNLGAARAGALLGGIAVGLTAVPWVLVFFGERIRARSPFASELMKG
jgi:multidrug resistance protein